MPQQPPFFHAGRLAFWNSSRHVYRIYVLPQELVFLKVGTGFRDPRSAAAAGGAVGAGLAALLAGRKMKQITEKHKQLDEADVTELRRLAGSEKGSFVATRDELADLRLEPPSRFLAIMLSGSEHAGLLRFSRPAGGKYKLELFSSEDAKTAYMELPRALGERIAVRAEWSEEKQRLLKKR
jgi:hypothetical protein